MNTRGALLALPLLILPLLASAAAPAARPLEGADFDFVLANLDKNSSYVKYGAVKLLPGGKTELKLWTGNQREPIPAQAASGPLSPTVENEAPGFHDGRAKILSHPSSFRGGARHVEGAWWPEGDGVCVRFEDAFALHFSPITKKDDPDWGRLYSNKAAPDACAAKSKPAPDTIVGVLSERVFSRSDDKISIDYHPFDGSISRLNGWDKSCVVLKWDKTMMNFRADKFTKAGKDVWRSVVMEPQKGSPDMPVFSYLSLSPSPVPEIGRVVVMDVGHDFNRNGRIDDDWGHIYAGFPILSTKGELGGALLYDFSPVGIKEIPYKGGCMANGAQLTHTLGLILYVANDLHAAL